MRVRVSTIQSAVSRITWAHSLRWERKRERDTFKQSRRNRWKYHVDNGRQAANKLTRVEGENTDTLCLTGLLMDHIPGNTSCAVCFVTFSVGNCRGGCHCFLETAVTTLPIQKLILTTVPLWHLFLGRVSYSVSIHSGHGFPFLHCSLVPPEGYSLLWSLSLTFTLMYEQLWSPMLLLDNGILQTVSLSLSLCSVCLSSSFFSIAPLLTPFARKCAASTVLCTVCIYYLCQQPFWAATHTLLLSIVSLTHFRGSSLVVVVLRR